MGNIVESEPDHKVAESIVALGNAFDMNLIAEGVETEPQEAWLRDADCQFLRGFRLVKPASQDKVEAPRALERVTTPLVHAPLPRPGFPLGRLSLALLLRLQNQRHRLPMHLHSTHVRHVVRRPFDLYGIALPEIVPVNVDPNTLLPRGVSVFPIDRDG